MNIAFIPVRGGSKSIPLKNIKKICGKPLVYWGCRAACECKYVDKVYISTDSIAIKDTVLSFCKSNSKLFSKVDVVERSNESATDFASTELAMLEFAEKYIFDNIVLIQATSPLLSANDLNRGFEVLCEDGTDSVLSAVKQKRFIWNVNEDETATAINYDIYNRPRRQNFEGYYVENGAFYITSRKLLIQSQNRVSGKIRIAEMNVNSFDEIDEPSDFARIEKIMSEQIKNKNDFSKIKMVLTDCDGCLTDGGMYYSEKGDEIKKFCTRDGVAFSLLKSKGMLIGMITGENVELNRRRAIKLKLDFYIPGCQDKKEAIKVLCEENNIAPDCVLFIGDDLNDIGALNFVGISCCPANACSEVRAQVDYVSAAKGGEGVVREITETLFR